MINVQALWYHTIHMQMVPFNTLASVLQYPSRWDTLPLLHIQLCQIVYEVFVTCILMLLQMLVGDALYNVLRTRLFHASPWGDH